MEAISVVSLVISIVSVLAIVYIYIYIFTNVPAINNSILEIKSKVGNIIDTVNTLTRNSGSAGTSAGTSVAGSVGTSSARI